MSKSCENCQFAAVKATEISCMHDSHPGRVMAIDLRSEAPNQPFQFVTGMEWAGDCRDFKRAGHPLSEKSRKAVINNWKILRIRGIMAGLINCTRISEHHRIFKFLNSEIKRLRKPQK